VYHIVIIGTMVESLISRQSSKTRSARITGDLDMSGTVTPDALDLSALLCSRICHDLISPVGAVVNGLEVLEEAKDDETRTFALELITKSSRQASGRLQFCRIAFGAAGSAGAQIDVGDAETLSRGFFEPDKTQIMWNLPRLLLPKNRVKLLLNMLIIAGQAIPRGGVLTVDPIGAGESMGFRVAATGLNARIPHAVPALLQGTSENGTVDAHGVQPYYTRLLAQNCGLSLTLDNEGDVVVFSTREPV
jgi:histidine phosphotransferase ChpT